MFKKTSEDFKITKLDYPFPIYEMDYTPIHPKEKLIEKQEYQKKSEKQENIKYKSILVYDYHD